MNNIQKAFKMQDIDVAWNGPEPSNINKISKSYLEESVNGYPRIIRSLDDTGNLIVIKQLKIDYKEIITESNNNARIAIIKQTASDIILTQFSDCKQRNMITSSIRISLAEEITNEQEDELQYIFDAWEWIDAVRNTSDHAESENLNPELIVWPIFP